MKTNKLIGKIILFFNKLKNFFLLRRFPWLTPRRYTDDSIMVNVWWPFWTTLDDMPEGWAKAFGTKMCKEIHKVLKKEGYLKDYRIHQVKEKYGELRWYDNFSNKELSEIKEKYRKLSRRTCIECGSEAEYVSKDWISPWCHKCAYDLYYKRKFQSKDFNICFANIDDYWKAWESET